LKNPRIMPKLPPQPARQNANTKPLAGCIMIGGSKGSPRTHCDRDATHRHVSACNTTWINLHPQAKVDESLSEPRPPQCHCDILEPQWKDQHSDEPFFHTWEGLPQVVHLQHSAIHAGALRCLLEDLKLSASYSRIHHAMLSVLHHDAPVTRRCHPRPTGMNIVL
jgi:hypothetical protein